MHQSLKHKLDAPEDENYRPRTRKSIGRPSPSSYHNVNDPKQSTATVLHDQLTSTVESEHLSLRNLVAPPTGSITSHSNSATSRTNQRIMNAKTSFSRPERKTMAVSQVSKHFVFEAAISGKPTQSTQRFSQFSIRPAITDTIPVSRATRRQFDPSKIKRSSEFAKNFILPTPNNNATATKSKRKDKFNPPLVSGGYAETLVNLMAYHKSEHTMWANAAFRQDKVFGSTEPIGIIEITYISKNHNLQWALCKIIQSKNSKPPFDITFNQEVQAEFHQPIDARTQPICEGQKQMPQTAEYEFVSSAPSQDQSNIIEVDSDPLQLEEEDSISGIDKGMHKMDVLLSSKSPVLDNSFDVFMEGQQKVRVQPDSNLNTICEEEPDTVHQLQFLMSSQGSEEGAQDENENEIDQIRKEFMQQRQLLCEAKHTLKSTTISCGSKTNVNDEIRNGNAAFSSDCALSKAAEAISGTYDRSLNLGNRYVSESVQDATENSSSFVEPKNPGSSLVIIFSNLFDWSALKVNDKVEIHEPCRKIAIPGLSMVAYGSAVWIAERYKVISNQR